MRYRFINADEQGQLCQMEFTALDTDQAIAKAAAIGFQFKDYNANRAQRAELQQQPKFSGMLGPMWDGDAIRYENNAAYEKFSA